MALVFWLRAAAAHQWRTARLVWRYATWAEVMLNAVHGAMLAVLLPVLMMYSHPVGPVLLAFVSVAAWSSARITVENARARWQMEARLAELVAEAPVPGSRRHRALFEPRSDHAGSTP